MPGRQASEIAGSPTPNVDLGDSVPAGPEHDHADRQF
jgi:hypothetical protein